MTVINATIKNPQAITVQTTAPAVINTTIKKYQIPFIRVQDLIDVDIAGLQDGYTLVYDSPTQKWTVQVAAASGDIDGGAY